MQWVTFQYTSLNYIQWSLTLFVYVHNYIQRSFTHTRCVGFVFAVNTAGAARASAGVVCW